MCVDERCTIVTSAPFSHSAPQMSNAELLEPTTALQLKARQAGIPTPVYGRQEVHHLG